MKKRILFSLFFALLLSACTPKTNEIPEEKIVALPEGITMTVDLVVCLALCVTVIIAKIVGGTLPLVAKALGADPAVMASPFITTIVDALSLLVYFLFAKALLGV